MGRNVENSGPRFCGPGFTLTSLLMEDRSIKITIRRRPKREPWGTPAIMVKAGIEFSSVEPMRSILKR